MIKVIDYEFNPENIMSDPLATIGYDGSNYKKNVGFLFIVGELIFLASIFLLFINTCCRKCIWNCRKIRRLSLKTKVRIS